MNCAQTETPAAPEGVKITETPAESEEAKIFTYEFMMGGRSKKLTVDYSKKIVKVEELPIHLTGKEHDLLEFLTQNAGRVCTKSEILKHLYGGMDEPEMKIIDVLVCKLRKKLSARMGGANAIGTAWGRGYHFDELKSATEDDLIGPKALTVQGPDGELISINSLPPPGTVRWVISRKVVLIHAIRGGLLSLEGALMRYPGLTSAEVSDWKDIYGRHGSSGLRATRVQQYR